MPYILNKTNGTKLTTLNDASLDISTSLTFVGRNYSGYGEVFNENFLKLLENFSNTSQPAKPLQGQLWFDNNSDVRQLKVCYDGKSFKGLANLTVKSTSTPDNPTVGDLWWDTANNQLSAFDGSTFVLVGPNDPSTARASWVPAEEVDSITTTSFPVIKGKFGSDILVVFSRLSSDVSSITPTSTDLTTNFSNGIKKGITLSGTDSTGSSQSAGNYFWGTASDALKANTATNVTVTNSVSGVYNLTFVQGTSGGKPLYTNSNISYNAGSNVLSVTATSAQYADLAEKYVPDRTYAPGTVVCIGGDKEITACKEGDRAIGAISSYPAYLMNQNLADGIPVALKGRVPIKFTGKIRKGDRLVAADGGVARMTPPGHPDVFAIALQSSDGNDSFIEALIL